MGLAPRTRFRRGVAAVSTGALLVLTSGCGNPLHVFGGGDPIGDYCAALTSDQDAFAAMIASNSPAALMRHLSMFQTLAAKAPDDIADDWQTFTTAIQGLQSALAGAGLEPSQYADGKPPAGLSARDRTRISVAADQLSRPATVDAADAIDQEARDVCKINLGL